MNTVADFYASLLYGLLIAACFGALAFLVGILYGIYWLATWIIP